MIDTTMNPTLLGPPPEIRLQVYPLVFDESIVRICGIKFRRGHPRDDLPYRGKRISTRQTYYGPTHVCRTLRSESLPLLLDRATLCCCHIGLYLVETYCLSLYREHFRRVSVDTQSIDPRDMRSLHPDILHRLCKKPSVLPRLQTLIVRAGPCLTLAKGFQGDTLQSTLLTITGQTAFEVGRERTRRQLLGRGKGTLARISKSEDRTFKIEIHTYLADFHPQDEEGLRGAAAFFGFDWDSGELLFWTLGEAPRAEDYPKLDYYEGWYLDRNAWHGVKRAVHIATHKLLTALK